jgi:hypothetical protein
LSSNTAFVSAAVATVFLGVVHALVPVARRRLGHVGEGVVASVGGGVASAYVFVHLLPELARGNEEVAEVLGQHVEISAFEELLLFVVAFAGFITLYGLDHAAERAAAEGGVFAVHLGAFAAYNALITYSLPTRFQVGLAPGLLFVVAMALHFVLADRALGAHYGDRFAHIGRPVLLAMLAVGYVLAWGFAPTSTAVVNVVLALLSGFVLYNVFHDELPGERGLRFPAFALAAGTYAVVLIAVAALRA